MRWGGRGGGEQIYPPHHHPSITTVLFLMFLMTALAEELLSSSVDLSSDQTFLASDASVHDHPHTPTTMRTLVLKQRSMKGRTHTKQSGCRNSDRRTAKVSSSLIGIRQTQQTFSCVAVISITWLVPQAPHHFFILAFFLPQFGHSGCKRGSSVSGDGSMAPDSGVQRHPSGDEPSGGGQDG